MNTELTATSIIALFDTNKEQRRSFITNLIEDLDNGKVDPLKIHYQVKCIEKIIDELTNTDEKKNKDGFGIAKRYKALVLDAAEKFGSKEFEFCNSKIKIGEVGSKYDYSQCGDVELADWNIKAAEIKAKIDARQKLLQSVPQKGMMITNEETGETFNVFPPSKSSTTSVIVTLK